ncbi:Adenylate cyclase [Diplonema papillatum]|nr:Adenylate cyclase [Diplonema papillatum]KAJ9447133.1 Adenylate cyclase [Diplonema papillatum]
MDVLTTGKLPSRASREKKIPQNQMNDSCLLRLCSIRVIFPFLLLLGISTTTVVVIQLLHNMYEGVLDEAEDVNVNAIDSTLKVARELAVRGTHSSQSSIGAVIGTYVRTVLDVHEKVVSSLVHKALHDPSLPKEARSNADWLMQLRFAMFNLAQNNFDDGVGALGVISLDGPSAVFVLPASVESFSSDFAPRGTLLVANRSNDAAFFLMDEDFLPTDKIDEMPLRLANVELFTEANLERDRSVWVVTRSFAADASLALMTSFIDPRSNTRLIVRSFVNMSKLALGLQKNMVLGEVINSRIFSVQASSPLAELFPESSPYRDIYNATGRVLFTSHGDFFYPAPDDPRIQNYYKDVDHPDLIVREVSQTIRNRTSYSVMAAEDEEWEVTLSNGVTYFVQVNEGAASSDGLHMHIVVVVAASAGLESMRDQLEAVKNRFLEEDDEKRGSLESEKDTTLITALAVSIALGLLLVALTLLGIMPLKGLQEDMERVASMQLEDVPRGLSPLGEIESMQVSFRTMRANLREFKAYVPNSVLNRSSDDFGENLPIEPPSGQVAFVFTDIRGSTAMWEKSPGDMDAALETHNRLMREAAKTFSGYEVKTIGDSFMLAFKDSVSALKFAFRAQKLLLAESWPQELDLKAINGSDGKPKFGGMPVRMGAHIGAATPEQNPITGRSDYRGGTVNMASRVEGRARSGTLCATGAFYQSVRTELLGTNPDSVGSVIDNGEHELKGLGNHRLYLLVPAVFKERLTDDALKYEVTNMGTTPNDGADCTHSDSGSKSKLSSRGSRNAPLVTGEPIKRTGLFLQHLEATVAFCKLLDTTESKSFEACNQVIRCSADAALLTDGTMLGLCGNNVILSWNTMKTCRLHATAALQFATELQRRCSSNVVRVGVVTGSMHYGNIGTISKRFSTVMGVPVTVASLAADLCTRFKTFCLVADMTQHNDLTTRANVSALLRLVDIWIDSAASARRVFLYELMTHKLNDTESSWEALDDTEITQHNIIFKEAMAGSEPAVRKLKKAAETDATIKVVCQNVSANPSPNTMYRLAVNLSSPYIATTHGSLSTATEVM